MENRELDVQVAEKVMGWVKNPPNNRGIGWLTNDGRMSGKPLPFSTDIAAAWAVVEKIVAAFNSPTETKFDHLHYPTITNLGENDWVVSFAVVEHYSTDWYERSEDLPYTERADTAPLAICRAALAAVEQGEKE